MFNSQKNKVFQGSTINVETQTVSSNESVQTKTKSYVNDVLRVNINDTDIVKCHRIGRTDRNNRSVKPRPILVKFHSTSLKSEVLNACRKIRNWIGHHAFHKMSQKLLAEHSHKLDVEKHHRDRG